MVFSSWNEAVFEEYAVPCINGFESLWRGEQRNTVTIDVPSSFYEKISSTYDLADRPNEKFELGENKFYDEFFDEHTINLSPNIPSEINGKPFDIFDHQRQSIRLWVLNQYKGILKLATGSGKTLTSIYAATKLYEAREKKDLKTLLIVAVPYKELAKQWVSNLYIFNIFPIRCWESKNQWSVDLKKDLLAYKMGAIDFLSVVVVNRTLESDLFQEQIREIDQTEIIFIGDECHNHGAKKDE